MIFRIKFKINCYIIHVLCRKSIEIVLRNKVPNDIKFNNPYVPIHTQKEKPKRMHKEN